MKLSQKLLVKREKTARKLKFKDWDPNYDAGKKREDVESEMVHFYSQASKLQYKLLQLTTSLF